MCTAACFAGVGSVGLCALGWFLLWAAGKDSPIHNFHQALETLMLISVLLLSLLINPYGVNLIRSWFETLAMPLPKLIQEHGPLDLASPIGCATLTLGVIYAIILLSALPQRLRITWLLPLVFFALALRVRNAPLFAITAALALPDMLPHSRLANWLIRRGWFSIPPELAWPCRVPLASRQCPLLSPGAMPTLVAGMILPHPAIHLPFSKMFFSH